MKKSNLIKKLFVALLLCTGATGAMAQCIAPGGLSVTNVNATTVTMSWNAVAGAGSYKISVDNAQGNNVVYNFEATTANTSYTLSGLTAGANYKFKVRTNCGGGTSNWSAWFNFTTGGSSGSCNIVPANLTVTNKTATSAELNWTAAAGANTYRVRVEDASGNNQNFFFATTVTGTSYIIQGLSPSSHYKFKVRSQCAGGNHSDWSAWVGFFTTAPRIGENVATAITVANVYPNPASDLLKLDINEDVQGAIEITMMDMTGKSVYAYNGNASEQANLTIQTAEFPAGFYQLSVKSSTGVQNTKVSIVH